MIVGKCGECREGQARTHLFLFGTILCCLTASNAAVGEGEFRGGTTACQAGKWRVFVYYCNLLIDLQSNPSFFATLQLQIKRFGVSTTLLASEVQVQLSTGKRGNAIASLGPLAREAASAKGMQGRTPYNYSYLKIATADIGGGAFGKGPGMQLPGPPLV